MKKGVYLLPNGLTLCGLFFGYFSILASLKANYVHAGWGILIALIFDGLDGWVARLTSSNTKFGIELDSLSDLIAFGVAPAVMIFSWSLQDFGRLGWAVTFLYVGCGALRLARYNIQMESTERKSFTGMPIPAAASVLATLVIFNQSHWGQSRGNGYFALCLMFFLALLMISTLRFHSIKEIDLRQRKPFWALVLIIVILLVIFTHPPIALFSFAMLYLITALIENLYRFRKRFVRKEN